jgi:hypothetical protein
MKSIYLILLLYTTSQITETPSVTVNYVPKKQWKVSKNELEDIKQNIEGEVR